LFNGHGDVVQTVDEAGTVQNQYDYDIWGNPTLTVETSSNAIRYSGEYMDSETGLYYLRARYYDPYIGRFISEDSYWGEDENPLSLNLYTYCHNDPIRYTDPTGHFVSDWDKQHLSKKEIKQLEGYGEDWNDAKKSGNQGGKDKSHDNAEKLRDKYRDKNEVGTDDGHTITLPDSDDSDSSGGGSGSSNSPEQPKQSPKPMLLEDFMDFMATQPAYSEDGSINLELSADKSKFLGPEMKLKLIAFNTQTKKEQPPSNCDTPAELIEWYLIKLGFTIETDYTIDSKLKGEARTEVIKAAKATIAVEKASALIIVQWYIGQTVKDTKVKINGKLDDSETLKALKILYDSASEPLKVAEKIMDEKWSPKKPAIDKNNTKINGKIDDYKTNDIFIPIPNYEGGKAFIEKNAGIAWAMMIQGAIEYNKHPNSDTTNKKLVIGQFAAQNEFSGYRPYHQIVEAEVLQRKGLGPGAADPVFDNPKDANAYIDSLNKKKLAKHWTNIPDKLTQKGGVLSGHGGSTANHGWGVALDMKTGGEKKGVSNDTEVKWLEKNAWQYGFEPLLQSPNYIKGRMNFGESWHWGYSGIRKDPDKTKK